MASLSNIEFSDKKNNRTTITHTIVWLILFLLPFVQFLYEPEKWQTANKIILILQAFTTAYMMVIFYLNLNYLAPKYLNISSNKIYILILLVGLIIYISINYMYLKYYFSQNVEWRPQNGQNTNFRYIPILFIPTIFYSLNILISTLLYLFNERRRSQHINQLTLLEKTATELNMLKLQISPHFLFNTLNNIRWLVRKKSEQSEEAILKLSEILRYIIYEVGDGKVDIKQEIDHLKNYIELQKLRLLKSDNIKFKVDSNVNSIQIQPLLFIHFVENAFKYGIDGKNDPDIYIELGNKGHMLLFKAKNKILNNLNESIENEGIGLTNIKRRLALLYPNKHELIINSIDNYFEISLKIEIRND